MTTIATGKTWKGIANIKYLVVFGASYCDVGYHFKKPIPTPEKPLGVDFPGMTWCGPTDQTTRQFTPEPNWVGHLLTLYRGDRDTYPLLVYDYALGGDRVDGVQRQVDKCFLPHLAHKPTWAPWSSEDTLFCTWVGINDCFYNAMHSDPAAHTQSSIASLFASQEKLYAAGARNFLFIDVPPAYIFPRGDIPAKLQETVLAWNSALRDQAAKFSAEHSDATVLIWSSHELFTQLLSNPELFGFDKEDASKEEGSIFEDGLHPTSAVHLVIARHLSDFLSNVQGSED
ncbi:hypothetical protein C8Q77DRAFT_1067250 [Trametes polyzona]|nr:hypothetical protein C8Q77DRAFT_1067250 [Trametes polyzona]